jgi:hypothetical protein
MASRLAKRPRSGGPGAEGCGGDAPAGAAAPRDAPRVAGAAPPGAPQHLQPPQQQQQPQPQPEHPQQQQDHHPRPAAAFSVVPNDRGAGGCALEDTLVLEDDLLAGAPGLPPGAARLFAVYDGHCGGDAAAACAERLHRHLAARLRAALAAAAATSSGSSVGDASGATTSAAALLESDAVASALRHAFVQTDAELRPTPGERSRGGGGCGATSGAAAVVALLTPGSIWLAWAGARRAGRGL